MLNLYFFIGIFLYLPIVALLIMSGQTRNWVNYFIAFFFGLFWPLMIVLEIVVLTYMWYVLTIRIVKGN